MIDYYSIDESNFSEKNFEDENYVELIKCLINRLIFSNIRLVSDEQNSTLKSFRNNLKLIKSLNSKKSIQKKLEFLIFHNKIRKSKFKNSDNLNNALKKYSFYNGQLVFDKEQLIDNSNLLIERNNDHIYDDLKIQEEGIKFNKIQNDDPLIKAMLGSTYIHFGVFNFIDNIYFEGNREDKSKIYFRKKILSESLEYFIKVFSLAQSEENNFFKDNRDQKKLIIYCSTKSKVFDSNYKSKMHAAIQGFFNNDLIHRKYINSFVENGGKIKICIFPNLNYENTENEDREDLHERFIRTQNGIFSISKDLDIFNFKNDTFTKKLIKFGYHTDFHAFSRKAKINNFQTAPFEINLVN